MKKIIDGKSYNTDTAEEICHRYYSNRRDFNYCWETLYLTKRGAFFIHGEGGPLSKYSQNVGLNEWSGGEDIHAVTEKEARSFAETYGTADKYVEFFGEPEEA